MALHRILKADGIDAVCMTGTDHPTGAVFVPVADAENRATIDSAIERMKGERKTEGDDVVEKDTRKRDSPALYHDVWLAIREACLRLDELDSVAISTNQSEQVALACRHHVYRIRQFFSRLNGGENRTLEKEAAPAGGYPDQFTMSNAVHRTTGFRPSALRGIAWTHLVDAWIAHEQQRGALVARSPEPSE